MIDSLTSHNYRDFGARYVGTFGWLLQDTGKRLVHILRVGDERVLFTDHTNLEYHAKINSGVQFEFIPVDHGWFNTINGETVLLSRVPARQWKRGISDSNTQATYLPNLQNSRVNYALLASIFNDQYTTLNYRKTFTGVGALSKHFALSQKGVLYMYDRAIGKLDKNVITLSADLFKQELTDLINRNGWNIEIKVS